MSRGSSTSMRPDGTFDFAAPAPFGDPESMSDADRVMADSIAKLVIVTLARAPEAARFRRGVLRRQLSLSVATWRSSSFHSPTWPKESLSVPSRGQKDS